MVCYKNPGKVRGYCSTSHRPGCQCNQGRFPPPLPRPGDVRPKTWKRLLETNVTFKRIRLPPSHGSNLSFRHTNGSTACCVSNAKAVAFINFRTQITKTIEIEKTKTKIFRQNIGEISSRNGCTTGPLVEKTRGSPSKRNIFLQSRDRTSDSLILREELDDSPSALRGGPGDTWGGLWFFPLCKLFFFAPNQKQTFFFRLGKGTSTFYPTYNPIFCQFCKQTFYIFTVCWTNYFFIAEQASFFFQKTHRPPHVSSGRPLRMFIVPQ